MTLAIPCLWRILVAVVVNLSICRKGIQMRWPITRPSIRIASTPLREFSGHQLQGFGKDDLWIVPHIHRALTDTSQVHRFPDLPAAHNEQIVYWEGAFYLITMALGWSAPARGLKWWFDAGKPDDEPILYLLKSVWDHRGQIERLAAWLWFSDAKHEAMKLRKMQGANRDFTWNDEAVEVNSAFRSEVLRRWSGPTFESSLPLSAESPYELHLGHVFWMCGQDINDGDLRLAGTSPASATITVNSPSNWYSTFCDIARHLPPIGNRSWRVDIVVKGWGWMGTYRQSRDTGLWFLGKHSTHLRGN